MKKVLLRCVYKKNLGDDLLIKIICDRYPLHKFYIINDKNGEIIDKPKNLFVIKPFMPMYRIFRKIAHLTNTLNVVDKILLNRFDFVVSIAGSIFMENKDSSKISEKLSWFTKINKPYYIVGSNIGPIYSTQYVNSIKKNILSNAVDVCLRDYKSFNMVKDLPNVRYASDIVFSLDVSKYKKVISKNKVIISVINIDKKNGQMVSPNKEKYYMIINDLIERYSSNGYEIELFSFCQNEEGDDETVNELLKINKDKKISAYFYNGNIDKAINELASSKIIIGSRFHANVLGLLLNKKVIPIIYNDKTREMLSDIKFPNYYIDLEKTYKKISKENEYEFIDISNFIKDSKNHFSVLDKILLGDDFNE